MMPLSAEIAMAEDHVRRGEVHIRRQHEIIARLRSLEADTALAEVVLGLFEETQTMHQTDLRRARDRLTAARQ